MPVRGDFLVSDGEIEALLAAHAEYAAELRRLDAKKMRLLKKMSRIRARLADALAAGVDEEGETAVSYREKILKILAYYEVKNAV